MEKGTVGSRFGKVAAADRAKASLHEGPTADLWPPALPPWGAPRTWTAVTAALAHHLDLPHIGHDRSLCRKARAVVRLIARLDPAMHRLCQKTCPDCPDPCCQRATVWYDTADLLVLGLTRSRWPAGQPHTRVGQSCRYLGASGCRLARIQRPWICTWYLCPRQTARLAAETGSHKRCIEKWRWGVKRLRRKVEAAFVSAAWAPRKSSCKDRGHG